MEVRNAARMVVLGEEGKVAIINVGAAEYYKIPGGGVEVGEDVIEAAKREAREETGCETEVIGELGRIETEIAGWNLHDISDGFIGRVVGEKKAPEYDDYEKERGFSVEWYDLDEAVRMIEANVVEDRDKKALQARDLEFLKRGQEYLKGGLEGGLQE